MKKRKKKGYIYTITGVRFGYQYWNNRRSKDGIFHSFRCRTSKNQRKTFDIIDQRTWGCCKTLTEAKNTVTKYAPEWILENNWYTMVVIERFEMTGVSFDIPKEWWYRWEGTEEKGKYVPAEKPKEYENVCGFAMG